THVSLRYKNRDVVDYDALTEAYPDAEFRSPFRSTIPLLAFWRDAEAALSMLSKGLSLPRQERVELLFEHQVGVKAGRGKASHTDLMVRSERWAVAIEAKYTEPGYETAAQWLNKSEN